MPIKPKNEWFLNSYLGNILCLDEKDIILSGDNNSNSFRLIQASIVKCRGQDYCKTEKEIDDFLKDSFAFILSNEVRFESRNYGKEAIIK